MDKNSERVNGQDEELIQDTVASAAEPMEELEAVEAIEGEGEGDEPVEQDEVSLLQESLAQAEAQANEYLDGWQRARAEFANYRRREETRREQAASEISARVLGHFLSVLDDLQRAFLAVPPEVQDSSWLEGLSLVGQKMLTGMEKEGVTVMPSAL